MYLDEVLEYLNKTQTSEISNFNSRLSDVSNSTKCLHFNYKMVGEYCEIYYCPDCHYQENIDNIF